MGGGEMKAVFAERYGGPEVLEHREVPVPEPGKSEVLVKIQASTVSAGVLWVRKGQHPESLLFTLMVRLMFGIRKLRNPILGYEFSGTIEKIGKNVSRFRVGDGVYGTTTGLKQGAYGEYACIPEQWSQGVVSRIPAGLSYELAAALPVGGMTALQILQRGDIQKGEKILIYGASGSVGTYALQIAAALGLKVTGVCSTGNMELVRSLGAAAVIDYTKEELTSGIEKYDIIFDAAGKWNKASCKALLRKGGRFLSVKTVTREKQDYLQQLESMVGAGSLRPVIDRIYPLREIITAHAYADQGHKRGNVVVKITEE
jgi:NADPH:quinone reductase-like Zn-dependent oxidoreductase